MKNQVIEISTEEAMIRSQNGSLFVDVREIDEVKDLSFDVPNIINIPLSLFEKSIKEISKDKDTVLVCRGGFRSFRATELLMKNGFTKVSNMEGGIIKWVENNFPVKKDSISN